MLTTLDLRYITTTGATAVLSVSALDEFQSRLQGQLLRPGSDGYNPARQVWNGMIDRKPALIVHCASVRDVVESVKFARAGQMLISVRGGGHNVTGNAVCDGGLMIDLSALKHIEVYPEKKIASAEPGVLLGEFDAATQAQGLATTGGIVSTTGLAGLTLGGGIGWLSRKHGLAIDNLLSVQVVTAEGDVLTASATENADLFWGLRGGGGNFGIAVKFEYQLHPVGPMVLGGLFLYPFADDARTRELIRFYRDWAATLPDEFNAAIAFLTAPPAPFVPEHLRGTTLFGIAGGYFGLIEEGQALMEPLRNFAPPAIDLFGPMPYTALQSMLDEGSPAGLRYYWKSDYYDTLSDGLIEALIANAQCMPPGPSIIGTHQLGGASARIGEDDTAFSHRKAAYAINVVAGWSDPQESERHIQWVRDSWTAFRPFSTGGVYVNFLGDEGEARVREAFGAAKYDRLVALKNKYDPTNLFRLNQNIKPRGL